MTRSNFFMVSDPEAFQMLVFGMVTGWKDHVEMATDSMGRVGVRCDGCIWLKEEQKQDIQGLMLPGHAFVLFSVSDDGTADAVIITEKEIKELPQAWDTGRAAQDMVRQFLGDPCYDLDMVPMYP